MPVILAFIIHLWTYFPNNVEKYYSRNFYLLVSNVLRMFCYFFSFSAGDYLYLLVGIIVMFSFVRYLWLLYKVEETRKLLILIAVKLVRQVLYVYIVFMLLWGLNYSRAGIGNQLNLKPLPYSTEDICNLSQKLIVELNYCRNKLDSFPQNDSSMSTIYNIANQAYQKTAYQYPFLEYKHPVIKRSLYTHWASWIGYTGYYNPLTGEAQVRTDLPRILLPFIVCHEAAHQIGYADESEASFVALIVSEKSNNVYLRYSALIDLYRFTRMELFLRNTYPDGPDKLNARVKNDLLYIRVFFNREAFNQSETITNAYDLYLRANGLKKGVESYNDVVAWAINWCKSNGQLN